MTKTTNEELYPELPAQDPDYVLITDYLAGELTDDEADAVAERLKADIVFFNKVWPMVRAWERKVPVAAPELGTAPRVGERAGKFRPYRTWSLVGLAAAAGIAAFVMVARTKSGVPGPAVASAAEAARADSILGVLRASGTLAQLPGASVISTGEGETRVVMLADSVRVTLEPRSWIAYSDSVLRDGSARSPGAVVGGAGRGADGAPSAESAHVGRCSDAQRGAVRAQAGGIHENSVTTMTDNDDEMLDDWGGEPLDEDIGLITDYLAGEMTEEQEAAVEKRLEEDEAFFDKVWPLVQLHDLPIDFRPKEKGG